jgi:hypothetical protein
MAEKNQPRPTYPSDEARRKVKPHVRIHHSVANHPKTAAIWADPTKRGMLVELWRLASVYGAVHTGGWLTLKPADLHAVTGSPRLAYGRKRLLTVGQPLEYSLRLCGQLTMVLVRNFAEKQNLTPRKLRNSGCSPSPLPTPKEEEEKLAPKSALVVSASPKPTLELAEVVTADAIVDGWQTICVPRGAPSILEVTGERSRKLRARIRDHPSFDWWQEVFNRMAASPFLFGDSERGWRVSFDWLIANQTNAVKILEGRYEHKQKISTAAARFNRGAVSGH